MRGVRVVAPVVLVPVAALVVPSLTAPAPQPREVPPAVTVTPLDGVAPAALTLRGATSPAVGRGPSAGQAGELVAMTDATPVPDVAVVGVTWDDGAAPAEVDVRVREAGGWGDWQVLPIEDEHGPDPGSKEAAAVRAGTDPFVVTGGAQAVQVRVRGPQQGTVRGMRLEVVDPGRSPFDERAGRPAPGTAAALPDRPTILTRADWGADESLRGEPTYGVVRGGFVHHTVNANTYTAAEVPAIIRGIYAFHVNSRGYKDIGYNFLVDRFGRIWEGRFGGVDRAVVGAHTLGYNDVAFAMGAIGTFTTTQAPSSVVDAYGRLFAWKMAVHEVDPSRPVNMDGEVRPAIGGHRDVNSTECPGNALYAQLGAIRTLVAQYQGSVPALTMRRDVDNREDPDVLAVGADGYLNVLPGTGSTVGAPRRLGGGWGAMDILVSPGDWTGDGADDFLARRASDGALLLYASDGSGGFRSGRQVGRGWLVMTAIIPAGDWDSDGDPDLLARRTDGTLWLYRGDGEGGFAGSIQVGRGWNTVTAIVGAGDWDGDGDPDLLARFPDGTLWLYPGTGTGAFAPRSQIGTGWNVMDTILGAGDVDGDGAVDVLARRADTRAAWLYPGDGQGLWKSRSVVGDWSAWPLVS